MNSKLFFNYPTCIDHAIVDNMGFVVGGSYHPVITVGGKVTEDESVVVDFSSGKKRLKEIIDSADGTIGFDHKLWIIPGYSACMTKNYSDTHYEIETKVGTIIRLPKTDVHIVGGNFDTTIARTVERDMAEILMRETGGIFDIEVSLTQNPFALTAEPIMFRYSHGLRDSTSYGCKNIAHGHLSFFEVTKRKASYRLDCQDCQTGDRLLQDGFRALNGTMFIMRDNIAAETENHIEFRYDTPRGEMYAKINKHEQSNVILDTETTIEYLAEFVKTRFMNALLLAKVDEFRISEGLQKGIVVNVLDDDGTSIF